MSLATIRRWAAGGLLGILGLGAGVTVFRPLPMAAQEELTRKTKSKVSPVYPDIARRMSISGTVKIEVVVAPNGTLKTTKVLGGHPVLVNAAVDAVRKWKFEPASEESTGILEFKFQPQD